MSLRETRVGPFNVGIATVLKREHCLNMSDQIKAARGDAEWCLLGFCFLQLSGVWRKVKLKLTTLGVGIHAIQKWHVPAKQPNITVHTAGVPQQLELTR